MKDIFAEVDNSERVNKAKERMEQLKARYNEEVRAANQKHRKVENHHKFIIGGIVAKRFPDCYQFEEPESASRPRLPNGFGIQFPAICRDAS